MGVDPLRYACCRAVHPVLHLAIFLWTCDALGVCGTQVDPGVSIGTDPIAFACISISEQGTRQTL